MKMQMLTKLSLLSWMCFAAAMVGCDSKGDVTVEGAPDLSEIVAPDVEMPTPGSPVAAVKTVSVKIDTMSCVEGCFHGIQGVLKKREGIVDVTLAPQKNTEGLIDNSVINISYRGDLDRMNIEKTILGAGFDGVEFVDPSEATAADSVVDSDADSAAEPNK